MIVRFIPDPEPVDDRPMALDPVGDVVIRCRFCRLEWRMPNDPAAERSLRRHFARKHPAKRQPATLTTADLRPTAAVETRYLQTGRTKRSRENPLRLTDGRTHPVTVRWIDGEAR